MLRLVKISDVSFCGLDIYLGTEDEKMKSRTVRDACGIFKDAYSTCILNESVITEVKAKKSK